MKKANAMLKKQSSGNIVEELFGGRRMSFSFISMSGRTSRSGSNGSLGSVDPENLIKYEIDNNHGLVDNVCASGSARVGIEPPVEQQEYGFADLSPMSSKHSSKSLLSLVSKNMTKNFSAKVGVEPAPHASSYKVNDEVLI